MHHTAGAVGCGTLQFRVQFEPRWRRQRSPDDRRFWLLWSIGFRIVLRAEPIWEFTVLWKRLALLVAVFGVGGYFGLVSFVHWRWQQIPDNRVRWIDLALAPVRWEQLRHKRGETALITGLRELEEGKIGSAVFNLRAGLARAPDNVPARLALSEVFALSGDANEAIKTVEQGLAHVPLSSELIGRLFLYLSNSGAWSRQVALADELLSSKRQPALPPELRDSVTRQRVVALLKLGRAAQALAALDALPPAGTADGRRDALALRLQTLQQLGRTDDARALYQKIGGDNPAERGSPNTELAIARYGGDAAAVESALRRLRAANPDSIEPFFTAFRTWHELGRTTLSEAVAAEISNLYARDENALQRFSKVLVELERAATLQRLRAAMARQRFNPFACDVGLTEIALRRGQWDDASALLAQWDGKVQELPDAQRVYPEFVRRLARVALVGGSGDVAALLAHLESQRSRISPVNYVAALRILEQAGRVPAAREVARLSVARYDGNDELRAVEARLATLEAVRTSVVAAPAARAARGSAEFDATLHDVDAALGAGRLDAAAAALRALKSSLPTPSRDEEHAVALREIRLACLQGEGATARFMVRRYLDRFSGADDALALVALAAELKQAGRKTTAELLQNEVATARLAQPEVAAALAGQGFSGDNSALVSADETRRSIEEAFTRGDFAKVPQIVRLVRRAAPDWLGDLAPELALAEMRARALSSELPSASYALRELLLRPGQARAPIWATLRLVARDGRPDAAQALAEQAVRIVPDDASAQDLLTELRATPAKEKP